MKTIKNILYKLFITFISLLILNNIVYLFRYYVLENKSLNYIQCISVSMVSSIIFYFILLGIYYVIFKKNNITIK